MSQCIADHVSYIHPYTISHTITAATFYQQNHISLTTTTITTQIHQNHNHQQSCEIFSPIKNLMILHNFEKFAKLAQKYAFLYKPTTTRNFTEIQKRHTLAVLNVWMIHKIEIFPHYTYPLPDGGSETKNVIENGKQEGDLEEAREIVEEREIRTSAAKDNSRQFISGAQTHSSSRTQNFSTSPTSTITTPTPTQPYRTCSHYGFNYPITYQPNITIHPAHLLTAVQLQREKVIAFIKSTAMSLNTSYFPQQQHQHQQQRDKHTFPQPRAPRLKSSGELMAEPVLPDSNKKMGHNTTPDTDKVHYNTDSNGSYISVKEIKLKPAKRGLGDSKNLNERDCCESFAGDDERQPSEHDHDMHTEAQHDRQQHQQHQKQQQDSLSEHFSSLLSIGGTSYPAGSHSHTGDLAHEHDDEEEGEEEDDHDHENEGSIQHQHYDDSCDNTSSIFTHVTPTTRQASYVLRDFLPAHAQTTQEINEHKPESEQELVQPSTKGDKLLTSAVKMSQADDDSDDGAHTPLLHTHQSHKQIKLTLNSNTTAGIKRRCSSHSSQEAAVSIALPPPERYRHVTASLSEADSSLSAPASSSIRSLEIHININVKNSDCARTLQTHETEFRRKLESIINEEINLIAQQLSGNAQYVSSNHIESGGCGVIGGGCGGVHFESKVAMANSLLANSPRHHHQHHHHHNHLQHNNHTLPHMETLNDLRLVGTLADGDGQQSKYRRGKLSKCAHLQPESQQEQQQQQQEQRERQRQRQHQPYTQSTSPPPPPPPPRSTSAASFCSSAAHSTTAYDMSTPPLTQQQRQMLSVLEQELESLLNGIICANALHNHAVMCDCKMKVAQISQELRASLGENVQNGDHSEAHLSTFSQSSKEDVSTDGSPKKDKKKKKGLRTPSFLKKKKEKKKAEA